MATPTSWAHQLHPRTFAHVMIGNTLRTDIYDLATTPAGEVSIEHVHVLLQLLLGVATVRLPTLDQHGLGELMVETHHGKTAVSKRRYLKEEE